MATTTATTGIDDRDLWWLWMLRSLALIFFGIFAAGWPGLTLALVVTAFALLLLVNGIVDLVVGVGGIGRRSFWFLTLLLGLFEAGLAIYLLRHGIATIGTFIAIIGIGLLVKGVLEVVTAFDTQYPRGTRFLFGTIGLITFAVGAIILANPASGGLAFVWALGVYGIIAGGIGVVMALSHHNEYA